MPKDGKLIKVIKHQEAKEKDALLEKTKTNNILDQRKNELTKLNQESQKLKDQLKEILSKERNRALLTGQNGLVIALNQAVRDIRSKIEKLGQKIKKQAQEVQRAEERLALNNQQLINARIEKKKIETIVKTREFVEDSLKNSLEESDLDELSTGKK